MDIKLKFGIDLLLFGMTRKSVEDILGKSNYQYNDDEDNLVLLYYKQQLKLVFYAEEDFKLGYIISTYHDLKLFGNKIINENCDLVLGNLALNHITKIEQNFIDGQFVYFNEEHWLLITAEFDQVIRVELGAVMKSNSDEFDWKE